MQPPAPRARARAGRRARGHHPHTARPGRARRGRHHRAGLGLEPGRARPPRRRHRGVAPRGRLRPRRRDRRSARRVNVDGTATRARLLPPAGPALRRLHYVSTCYVSGRYDGRVHRGRPRRGPELPQPLRGDEVRGRAAGPQGDGRRAAGHRLPPRHRRRRLDDRRRRRSTTAPTSSRPSCAGSRSSRSCRPSATPTACGSAWCRATSWSRRWTCSRCWTDSVGRTYALTDPDAADGPRARRHLRPAPGQAGGLGAAAARADPGRLSTTCPAWSGCSACRPRPSTTSPRRRRTRRAQHARRPRRAPAWSARPSRPTPAACSTSWPTTRRSTRRPWSERPEGRAPARDEHRRRGSMARQAPARRRQRQPHGPRAGLRRGRDLPRPRLPDRARRHRRRRRRRRGAGPPVGRAGCDAIAVTGVREARVAGLYDGELEADRPDQEAAAGGPGDRRHRAARRPAGVGDPARPDRDAGLSSTTRAPWSSAASTTPARSASCASSPPTSSSPTRCCGSTCRRSSRQLPSSALAGRRRRCGRSARLPGAGAVTLQGPRHRSVSALRPHGRPGTATSSSPPTTS